MTKKTERNLIAALDIGTSKVVCLVGEINAMDELEIIGIGSHPSRGLKRGVVIDIERTMQSIQQAVAEAETMANCQIRLVYASISGSHIRSLNSHGVVPIRDSEVTASDVERVLDAARAVAIPSDQQILHVLPQAYIIDSQQGIREPIGMAGVRLEARVHLVIGSSSAVQNITKCVKNCGLEVVDMTLEQLASSYAVLNEDEKELGVCLVDIGGGTTDIAIFVEGSIRYTAVIPIAGNQVTNDIALALVTATQNAEEVKLKQGCALKTIANPETIVETTGVSDRPRRRSTQYGLAEVIEPRYEELFRLIQTELRRSGFEDNIASGMVLTGGAAQMPGALELAEEIFRMPVRLGMPQGVSGLSEVIHNPIYAASVGLLLSVKKRAFERRVASSEQANFKGLWTQIKNWFQGNF